jgi:hypothetical protein
MSKLIKQILFMVVLALTVGFWFQSSSVTVFAQNKTTLNQKQAVEIAEKFIAANGYTEKSVSRSANLYLEEGENASDLRNILAARLESIESRAVFALVQEVDGQSFWVVRFLFREEKIEGDFELGREVRVSLDESKVWMNSKPVPVQEARRFGDCTGEDEKPPENF